ncbi:MAG: alcohol dehydrogenase catalytic domain-containing protein [Nitrososphaerales archaeon]|nr:alcohol dehydrogenase catalytic domain-containing protein [Nitrososphaerales archaeon]
MKSLVLSSPGHLEIKQVPVPKAGRGELLVKMKCSGVCGTDIEKVRGEAITPPVLGHEVVGVVAKLGDGVRGLRKGDRVFAHHHAPCHKCSVCARGEYTLCAEFPKHNIRPGGFAEYFVVPRWNVERGAVLKLPGNLSFEEASFIEPLGCCLRGLEGVGAAGVKSAVIYGAGPVGLTHLLLLHSFGCRKLVMSDLSAYRLSFAKRLGASRVYDPREEGARGRAFELFGSEGPELALVATGSPAAFKSALQDVSKGGKVLLFGAPPKGATVEMNLAQYFLKGMTVVSSYSTTELETRRALRLLADRKIHLSKLVTQKFSLEEAPEAFRVAREQKCIKAVVCD